MVSAVTARSSVLPGLVLPGLVLPGLVLIGVVLLGGWLSGCGTDDPEPGAQTVVLPDLNIAAECAPDGTGDQLGDKAADIAWQDSSGQPFDLHSLCGRVKGVVVVESAEWCVACIKAAPLVQSMNAFYAPLGIRFVLAVGEAADTGPATVQDARIYKLAHGYDPSFIAVADQKWARLRDSVGHPDEAVILPWWVVLDQDMRIAYMGSGGKNAAYTDIRDQLEQLTGQRYDPPPSCDGFCGGLSAGGCWCDQGCLTIGDCCEDNCGVCGNCP